MTLTPDQAAEALKDIEAARSRTRTALNYREGALHLILWGALIIVGHVLTDFRPAAAQGIWIAVNGLGAAGSCAIGYLRRRESGQGRAAALLIIAVALCYVTESILWQATGRQIGVIWAIHAGAAYMIAGLWLGRAYLILGAGVIALSLIGYFAIDSHFNLWMAAVFGGSVLSGGLWMRRAP